MSLKRRLKVAALATAAGGASLLAVAALWRICVRNCPSFHRRTADGDVTLARLRETTDSACVALDAALSDLADQRHSRDRVLCEARERAAKEFSDVSVAFERLRGPKG